MLGRGRIQSWDKVAEDSMVPTLYPVGGKAATGARDLAAWKQWDSVPGAKEASPGLCRGGECTC